MPPPASEPGGAVALLKIMRDWKIVTSSAPSAAMPPPCTAWLLLTVLVSTRRLPNVPIHRPPPSLLATLWSIFVWKAIWTDPTTSQMPPPLMAWLWVICDPLMGGIADELDEMEMT